MTRAARVIARAVRDVEAIGYFLADRAFLSRDLKRGQFVADE